MGRAAPRGAPFGGKGTDFLLPFITLPLTLKVSTLN